MIKRIRFAAKQGSLTADAFAVAWRDALGRVADAPESARPLRVVSCVTLPDVDGCDARHDAIAFEWFTDAEHLDRFDAWLATDDGVAHEQRIDALLVPESSALVVADESIGRGADWLEQRWRDRDDKFKHMAVALRASGLSQTEFSELWKSRAGQVRTSGAATATEIPDVARGLAYVQNHPRPRATGDWPYDAVNEVYFDDLDALRQRVEFFRETLGDQTEDDLVRENWFVVAREEVVAS